MDSGALLAHLEEQRRDLIQDGQQLEAVLTLRIKAIARENQEAGGSSHHFQVLLQRQDQDNLNLTLTSGRILQLDSTTAAIRASHSSSPGVLALAPPAGAPTRGGRPREGNRERGGSHTREHLGRLPTPAALGGPGCGGPAMGGPAWHLPSISLDDVHTRAINPTYPTGSSGYGCLLCNEGT